ncbi:hypothetical protein ACH5RR_032001 [Cinchona calisaya]|uniref:TF-B3 domain-containing protein n=1 Tax=Cinchona calisaya TaxID=153742 RepID=A0ABD2YKW9_9GENT
MVLLKYKGKAKFDVCIFYAGGVEILYPMSGLALMDNDVMLVDEGFTGDRSEDTIIISSSSNDDVSGAMVGQSRKDTTRLRNMLRAGLSRAFALNKQKVKSLGSSSVGKSHLQYVQRVFDSTVPLFFASMHSHGLQHSHTVYVLARFSHGYLKDYPSSINIRAIGDNQLCVRTIAKNGLVVRLSNGWHEVENAFELLAGDICVFELIDPTPVVLNITVFSVKLFVAGGRT